MASRRLLAVLTIGCSLVAGAALAQPMPPNPGPDRPGPMAGGPGGMMDMMRMMHRHHHHGPPPPDPAAHFRFRRGDAEIDIHCAVQEPMRACVDAASTLLDKVQSMGSQTPQPQR